MLDEDQDANGQDSKSQDSSTNVSSAGQGAEASDSGTQGSGAKQEAGNDGPAASPRRRRAASRPAGAPSALTASFSAPEDPVTARSNRSDAGPDEEQPKATKSKSGAQKKAAAKKANAGKAGANKGKDGDSEAAVTEDAHSGDAATTDAQTTSGDSETTPGQKAPVVAAALFQAPTEATARKPRPQRTPPPAHDAEVSASNDEDSSADRGRNPEQDDSDTNDSDTNDLDSVDANSDDGGPPKRRRRRGGRRRRKPGADNGDGGDDEGEDSHQSSKDSNDSEGDSDDGDFDNDNSDDDDSNDQGNSGQGHGTSQSSRRRRRRRSSGGGSGGNGGGSNNGANQSSDDPPNTVVHVRDNNRGSGSDQVSSVRGSTRLEAKKQRRREGREAGRRRTPILTEAEFLARRESVDRVMVVRQQADRTQIAVLEDNVLSEHYVNRSASTSMVGNVYLGRVQNVLPSMEAAFVDIGRGRNAVLYAGEVNWDAVGLAGQPKRIELALKSGDPIMVQVTKDPVGHKGARLTSQISLPGRYLVYVPGGSMTGISRRLPDSERSRLKKLLRSALPADAGVIVRTAAEGATEEQISRDVARLTSQWEKLNEKTSSVKAPELLHGEPDLATRVVRDIFNEDFSALHVSGDRAAGLIEEYISAVAPDLKDRVKRWTSNQDVFAANRIDEQLAKALDRKVWLPSGGSLVIDHTEAMTVVDVNTGKFIGQGGNLEETVTKNNLEAAEEIVRQLRLRDVGGIIVIDFIDMVLEDNRDLVLRRLLECLGRDRTKHQVAEVTSLGLVQMTRKRIGQGLLETFSEPCECCNGRGVKVQANPVDQAPDEEPNQPRRRRARPAGPIPGAPTQAKAQGADGDDSDDSEAGKTDLEGVVSEALVPEGAPLETIDSQDSQTPESAPESASESVPESAQQGDEAEVSSPETSQDEPLP